MLPQASGAVLLWALARFGTPGTKDCIAVTARLFADATRPENTEGAATRAWRRRSRWRPLHRKLDRRAIRAKTQQDIPAIASPGGFSLLLIDVDEFKRIDDTSGHDAGDPVLIGATSIMGRHAAGCPPGWLDESGTAFHGRRRGASICEH
ncbi:diguanylate cyclase domain-containing protein [Dyella jiangningensis]|uniref:diguanylate cyclase domain-containing protein n=1 Tax=Dyella jiangningensis TaxID=1379159 RepID=UPI0015584707|nr:diguanylate cyclase [Dyella jiangningensis]